MRNDLCRVAPVNLLYSDSSQSVNDVIILVEERAPVEFNTAIKGVF